MKRYRVSGDVCLYGVIEIEWTMTMGASSKESAEDYAIDVLKEWRQVGINDVEELEGIG